MAEIKIKVDREWMDKTCDSCVFSFYNNSEYLICRKNPPSSYKKFYALTGNDFTVEYPVVNKDTPSCSCWREK